MPIKNILVVDDSPTDRQHLTDILAKGGYNVSTAASAEEGIAKVKQSRPDLVLMDILMPNLDGLEACRKLRATERYRSTPFIVLTARTGSGRSCGPAGRRSASRHPPR